MPRGGWNYPVPRWAYHPGLLPLAPRPESGVHQTGSSAGLAAAPRTVVARDHTCAPQGESLSIQAQEATPGVNIHVPPATQAWPRAASSDRITLSNQGVQENARRAACMAGGPVGDRRPGCPDRGCSACWRASRWNSLVTFGPATARGGLPNLGTLMDAARLDAATGDRDAT